MGMGQKFDENDSVSSAKLAISALKNQKRLSEDGAPLTQASMAEAVAIGTIVAQEAMAKSR